MPIAPPDPPLTDGIVTLRPSMPDDLSAIEEGINDPEVVRWVGPPEGSAAHVLALNEQRWTTGSPTLSICDADGSCVGLVWINVREGDAATGSVGYWLLPQARGRGLATRAVRLIARWATRELGMTRLLLTTEPGNARSRLVARRSGFREVAVLRASAGSGDRVIDQVVHEYEDHAD